jgi:NitT/TauT family transport system substrate-binding protein
MNGKFPKPGWMSLLVLVVVLLTAGCRAGEPGVAEPDEKKEPLKITSTVWVGYGPLYLAEEVGIFDEEGVDVELFIQQDFKQQFASLAAKEIDCVAEVVDASISYYIPGLEYAMILAFDHSLGGDGIAATNEIQSIADLKGKDVAFETGATAQFFLNVMLFREGLTQDDINHIDMIGADAGAALLSGKVDAASTYEPYLTAIRTSDNAHVLTDTTEAPGLITDILICRKDVIEERREDVQAVVNGYFGALDYWEENPEDSITIMAEAMGGWIAEPGEFEATLDFVKFLDEEDNKEYFSDPSNEGLQILETTENAVEIWGKIYNLEDLPPAEEFVDASFILP